MRLDDDFDLEEEYEDNYYSSIKKSNKSVMTVAMVFVSALFLLILFLVVNGNKNGTKPNSDTQEMNNPSNLELTIADLENQHEIQSQSEHSVDALISGSTLTADDLDIWNTSEELEAIKEQKKEQNEEQNEDKGDLEDEQLGEEENEVLDPSEDGLHTKIVHLDGKEEWVDINQYLKQNTYNYSGLVYQDSIMKYYENNRKISHLGADISKNQDYVDFNALRKAGVEYVMIRLGQRGYQTGEITLDDYFGDNISRAISAGLDVGVYFFSQATTLEEAAEEADFVISQLEEYEITYPVVFYMDYVPRENTRGEKLEKMIRTNIAICFMDRVKEAGYMPMLKGTKEWLIQKYSLGSMMGYDVWLEQELDMPDYPYEFIMWQYTSEGKIDGIAGDANLITCFVDFSLR